MNTTKKTLKNRGLIYDVGMHKGEDTEYYLKKGFKVIGFEADPELVALCRARFSEEIDDGRLVIVEGAIVNSPPQGTELRSVKFYRNRNISVWGTVVNDWAKRNEESGAPSEIIEVPMVDFSGCLELYDIPYYLKIDIEGMDSLCLQKLLEFEIKPSYISIESEKVKFEKLINELDLMSDLGYTKFKAVQQGDISSQTEPAGSREGRFTGHRFQSGSSGLFGEDLPGKWRDFDEIVSQYRSIFFEYKMFGDFGLISRFSVGRVSRKILSRLFRRPIPGWYDTHAKHSSIA